MAYNGLGLGEVAAFGALHCHPALKLNSSKTVCLTSAPAISAKPLLWACASFLSPSCRVYICPLSALGLSVGGFNFFKSKEKNILKFFLGGADTLFCKLGSVLRLVAACKCV
jgi:hypothetical protein